MAEVDWTSVPNTRIQEMLKIGSILHEADPSRVPTVDDIEILKGTADGQKMISDAYDLMRKKLEELNKLGRELDELGKEIKRKIERIIRGLNA